MNRAQHRQTWLTRHRQQAARAEVPSRAPGGAPAAPPTVRVHVEELVLQGFAPGDRHAIGEAVQQELTRLLTEQGVPPALARGGETGRIDAGSFSLPRGARARAVGVEVARAVHRGAKR
jgi:hypothetical protein